MDINDKEFRQWLKLSDKIKSNGTVYYVLDAELLTIEEMYIVYSNKKYE